MSSAASILSGRSFGSRKITLRVNITVDYDGPSLSDTSSLISLEEYKGRNGSQLSFSLNGSPAEIDDDSVTVSSRDNGASYTDARHPAISETAHNTRPQYNRSEPGTDSSSRLSGSSRTPVCRL